jgi:hypothetical protein
VVRFFSSKNGEAGRLRGTHTGRLPAGDAVRGAIAAFFGFAQWEAIKRLGLLFVILLGSIWWARGFAAGALTGLSGIRGVVDPEENIFISLNQSSKDQAD